jgi:Putative zinc-binding metallo-peptidase
MVDKDPFHESNWSTVPIRDLGLTVEGTPLEPILAEFVAELERSGIDRIRPRFYLSTEWGVPSGSTAIAIPFYLARPELQEMHEKKAGVVEGLNRVDILRYLRHEMGHVVNYAYRLFEREEWVLQFGSITQPYLEEYRPSPFSRRYVRHLPGWYAQKHPDEDWAETFAVWMTPGHDWRAEYAGLPAALAKLEYCERTIASIQGQDPLSSAATLDEDVRELAISVEQYYREVPKGEAEFPRGLDGALRTIFDEVGTSAEGGGSAARRPASSLIKRCERELLANVFRWTGHFPERTRGLVRHLAERADQLGLVYSEGREGALSIGLTTLVTALAMNWVHGGTYGP